MTWLYLALAAYFINSIVFITDKYLLAAPIPKYHAYVFGASILSFPAIFLIPFGVTWYGWIYFIIAISSGASFFIGLMFLYKTIRESDVSLASTQVGTFGAISTYIFSAVLLKDTLPLSNSIAFLFLVLGIFLLGKLEKHIFLFAMLSGIFFGLSFVLLKLSFQEANFINGLFWTRMGLVGGALASLLSKNVRGEVKSSFHKAPSRSKWLFVFNKVLSGTGFIILYFAILLGNVSLVNALLGLQFLFTFLLAIVLRNKISGIKERLDRTILTNKLAGIISILIGFLILFVGRQ